MAEASSSSPHTIHGPRGSVAPSVFIRSMSGRPRRRPVPARPPHHRRTGASSASPFSALASCAAADVARLGAVAASSIRAPPAEMDAPGSTGRCRGKIPHQRRGDPQHHRRLPLAGVAHLALHESCRPARRPRLQYVANKKQQVGRARGAAAAIRKPPAGRARRCRRDR